MKRKNRQGEIVMYGYYWIAGIISLFSFFSAGCTEEEPVKEKEEKTEVTGLVLLEEFDHAGKPDESDGFTWSFTNDMYPEQKDWNDFIPGDGYAHITIDADVTNDQDKTFPFQKIAVKSIGPGHRLSMRAKGIAVSGVGGFIFTYMEEDTFDEIDIEIVPDDMDVMPNGHKTDPPDGWTDARFNSWGNSDLRKYQPSASYKKPVVDDKGSKVSLTDGKFHIFTIDWLYYPATDTHSSRIDFYIDDVLQQTINYPVPKRSSKVIMGFRQMKWCGPLNWPGTHTMLIDWVKIESIK